MKINTSTSSVRVNTLRLRSGQVFKLIISLIIPQLAGGLGSYFTIGSVKDWYPMLVKPALNPPAWMLN